MDFPNTKTEKLSVRQSIGNGHPCSITSLNTLQRIAKNYFTLNYDEPLYEHGIQCRDMVILSRDL
jgi:hypothetical protein